MEITLELPRTGSGSTKEAPESLALLHGYIRASFKPTVSTNHSFQRWVSHLVSTSLRISRHSMILAKKQPSNSSSWWFGSYPTRLLQSSCVWTYSEEWRISKALTVWGHWSCTRWQFDKKQIRSYAPISTTKMMTGKHQTCHLPSCLCVLCSFWGLPSGTWLIGTLASPRHGTTVFHSIQDSYNTFPVKKSHKDIDLFKPLWYKKLNFEFLSIFKEQQKWGHRQHHLPLWVACQWMGPLGTNAKLYVGPLSTSAMRRWHSVKRRRRPDRNVCCWEQRRNRLCPENRADHPKMFIEQISRSPIRWTQTMQSLDDWCTGRFQVSELIRETPKH